MSKPLILYHAGCADGYCAAWVARKAIIEDCEFIPVNYGQPPPDVKGREVVILDFSYKRPVLEQMLTDCDSMVVLDHHKTAEVDLKDFPRSVRCHIKFDMNRSGARLTWEHFFGVETSPPWLVDYTEDRDLWRWNLPESRAVNAALRSYPFDFEVWDSLAGNSRLSDMITEGRGILRYQEQEVGRHVKNAVEIILSGHKVLAVNATTLTSEIAGELAKGRPFGVCYFFRRDGKVQWSLRSDEKGWDVSEVARMYGGGGHKHAAGFESATVVLLVALQTAGVTTCVHASM